MIERPPIDRQPTAKQLKVLRFVADFRARHSYAPTHREICDHFGWTSTVAAVSHLEALERRGLVERVRGIARGLRLTEGGQSLCQP